MLHRISHPDSFHGPAPCTCTSPPSLGPRQDHHVRQGLQLTPYLQPQTQLTHAIATYFRERGRHAVDMAEDDVNMAEADRLTSTKALKEFEHAV